MGYTTYKGCNLLVDSSIYWSIRSGSTKILIGQFLACQLHAAMAVRKHAAGPLHPNAVCPAYGISDFIKC